MNEYGQSWYLVAIPTLTKSSIDRACMPVFPGSARFPPVREIGCPGPGIFDREFSNDEHRNRGSSLCDVALLTCSLLGQRSEGLEHSYDREAVGWESAPSLSRPSVSGHRAENTSEEFEEGHVRPIPVKATSTHKGVHVIMAFINMS